MKRNLFIALLSIASLALSAQQYPKGLVDKTIAVVGEEMIAISQIEDELQMMRAQGMAGEASMRCEILESLLESRLFLMQARIDSLSVNQDMVAANLNQRMDQIRTQLGGDEAVEEYFGKSMFRLRKEWQTMMQDQSLIQQMQQKITQNVPEVTPEVVGEYVKNTPSSKLPIVPIKYQISHVVLYPDVEKAKTTVKEKLLAIRERIINGEKFSTLARLYSQDPGSYRKGGELGMASKSIFWPSFSDAAMSLRTGVVSQVVETPDGFHLIEVLEKRGDMFNARHILMKPEYTTDDMEKAFTTLDSLKTEMAAGAITFEMAAQFYSQDPQTRTNGGKVVNQYDGSSFFEIDQLKPADYKAITGLKEGEISEPIVSLDDEGRSGNTIYKIIRVDKIIPSHIATIDGDYSILAEDARGESARKVIDEFINEKIKTTYIIIDPIFQDCDFNNEQWKSKFIK